MKRKVSLILLVVTWLLMGCTSEDQQFYTEAVERAKEKIAEESFEEAKSLLQIALTTDLENQAEATDLLNQLTEYERLADLLSQGEFSKTISLIDDIVGREDGSPTIRKHAEEYREVVEEAERNWLDVHQEIDDALKLSEKGEFEASNRQLTSVAVNLADETYFQPVKTKIFELIAENNEQILKIQEEEKLKAIEEEKRRNEADENREEGSEDEKNLFYAPDSEIEQFIADYLEINLEQLEISIYNRADTSFLVEVQEKEKNPEFGDKFINPILEFFKVNEDGAVLKMDKESAKYIPIDGTDFMEE